MRCSEFTVHYALRRKERKEFGERNYELGLFDYNRIPRLGCQN